MPQMELVFMACKSGIMGIVRSTAGYLTKNERISHIRYMQLIQTEDLGAPGYALSCNFHRVLFHLSISVGMC